MSTLIKNLQAYLEYDSKGALTISGTLTLDSGLQTTSSIPNYQSVNKLVSQYIDPSKAVQYINQILGPKLINIPIEEYKKIDLWLNTADKTEKKEVFGVNTLLLISKLIYKAGAQAVKMPLYRYLNQIYSTNFEKQIIKKLPTPIYVLITGGKHGAKMLNLQEFSVIFSTGLNFSQSLEKAVALHHYLATVFEYRNIFSGVGDDGAYVPNLSSNYDALEIVKEAILKNDYKIGIDIFFALDCAAEEFYKSGKYYLTQDVGSLNTSQMIEFYEKLLKEYRFLVLEDPFATDDLKGWEMAMQKFGSKAYILGDDLLSMNKKQLTQAVNKKLCSVVDLKTFQRGTIWDVFEYAALSRKAGLKLLLSQAPIETNDSFLADLAVGLQVDFVKFGAPIRGERIAKYNRLLAIEKELFHD